MGVRVERRKRRRSGAGRHRPFTVTVMTWWMEPSWFLAVQRYWPASSSVTLVMRSVLWKLRKVTLLVGKSPLTLDQVISGVGLRERKRQREKQNKTERE